MERRKSHHQHHYQVKERWLEELEILLRERGGGQGRQEGRTVRQMEVGVILVTVLDRRRSA